VQSTRQAKVITVRTASFQARAEGGSASVEKVKAAASDPGLSTFVEDKVAKSDRPELTSAKIIISGGRGVGTQRNSRK
jgi:electron transfer flavoprotein alpha subunit